MCLLPRNPYCSSKWASHFPNVALGGGRGATRGNWVEVSGAGLYFQNLAAGAEGGFLSRDCLLRAGDGGV